MLLLRDLGFYTAEESYSAVPVDFDGTGTYLTRGAGLTGAADSKLLAISFWFRSHSIATTQRIIAGANLTVNVRLVSSNIGMAIKQTSGSAGPSLTSSVLSSNVWYHVCGAHNMNDAVNNARWYINDASDETQASTYGNFNLDFTDTNWQIGAWETANKYNGDLADLWLAPGQYLDFDVTANRRKFITAGGEPVYLGADGSLPTGSAPAIFLSGSVATWHTNLGTGGGFTKNGSVTAGVGPVQV